MELLTASVTREPERPLAFDALVTRYRAEVVDLVDGPARVRLRATSGEWDALLDEYGARIEDAAGPADAEISADDEIWRRIALDGRAGFEAFAKRRLRVRRNLHLGTAFLAATRGDDDPAGLRFASYDSPHGRISTMEAGEGDPLICLPGLGGTKASFMTTVAALAGKRRVIAIDLPGFGDSDKPLRGRYDALWFAEAVIGLLDSMGIGRADLIGNSMGGRVALEVGLCAPERTGGLVLLSPSMAWLHRDRALDLLLRLPVSRLGLFQPTPRALIEPIVRRMIPGGASGWVGAGVDEFLRSYCTRGGRFAFYEAARNIVRDEPHGDQGFWERLRGLAPQSMFVWGKRDTLVPIAFMRHVERTLPEAKHLELDCGHVPQLELPARTHAAVERFLAAQPVAR
jgi:pimeloyl-ACP methyl ester carboxylesterase